MAEGFQDELNGHVFDLEKDGLRQFVPCPWVTMMKPAPITYRIGRRPVNKNCAFRRRPMGSVAI